VRTGRVAGKVAFITGAARGQGRSHAVKLASEGADIVALDICEDLPFAHSPHATWEDLQETVRLVEEAGGRIVARKADVRFRDQVDAVVAEGLETFGKIDVVVANAAAIQYKNVFDLSVEDFEAGLEVNLTGVFNTVQSPIQSMINRNEGGSIILVSSGITYRATPAVDYAAAKTALITFARALANEVGPSRIRVNTIHPGYVLSPANDNLKYAERTAQLLGREPFTSLEEHRQALWDRFKPQNMLPVGYIEPEEVSNAVLWLASDASRYVTAEELKVDAGFGDK
jgi:SDR family mycofactocin-dependent oxidoreductase